MTYINRFYYITCFMLLAAVLISIPSCSKDDDQSPTPEDGISQEIEDLIRYRGDETAPAVLIHVQGGPDTALHITDLDDLIEDIHICDLLAVSVHQVQTLNPSILLNDDLTLQQAVEYNKETIETLDKVVSFFQSQGRTVYVVGQSFGAFVVQELIAEKGIDVADKYLIMIGRLDINEVMWQALSEGIFGYFENGITPIVGDEAEMLTVDRNLGRIAAGFGMNRYTQRLNRFNDLSDVTYIYGARDEFVGGLTAGEKDFLLSKNANVIEGSGGHDDTYDDYKNQGLKEAFGLE